MLLQPCYTSEATRTQLANAMMSQRDCTHPHTPQQYVQRSSHSSHLVTQIDLCTHVKTSLDSEDRTEARGQMRRPTQLNRPIAYPAPSINAPPSWFPTRCGQQSRLARGTTRGDDWIRPATLQNMHEDVKPINVIPRQLKIYFNSDAYGRGGGPTQDLKWHAVGL